MPFAGSFHALLVPDLLAKANWFYEGSRTAPDAVVWLAGGVSFRGQLHREASSRQPMAMPHRCEAARCGAVRPGSDL